MELMLENVSYDGRIDESKLVDVTYNFGVGVNFLHGINAVVLRDLLFQNVSVSKGYVMVNQEASKKDVFLVSINEDFNKPNLLDEATYLNEYYSLGYIDVKDKLTKAMIMVGLNNYSNCYFSDLSSVEIKKIKIALALFMNSKIIIFDYIEKGMCYKDIEYIKKLIRKLSKAYNRNIIICSDSLNNYLDVVDNVVVIYDGKIVNISNKNDLYNEDMYKYIDMPDIIELIKYFNSRNHYFDNYIELKELLKAIYRDVENR